MRFLIVLLLISCQKQPSIPQKAMAPMGSSTNNGELAKKVEAFHAKGLPAGLKKEFSLAELYFEERRFIEASQILSKILDKDAKYPQARNLLARCFYFLGNPDRSLAELDFILSQPGGQADDMLDALFLTGAVVLESNPSEKMRKKGIAAWENYLKIAPQSELRKQVTEGLARLKEQGRAKSEDWMQAEQKLREKKGDAEGETTLARIAIRTHRVQEALQRFEAVVKKYPKYVPAWHYKGMAHMLSGDPRQAIVCWERVMELNPAYGAEHRLTDRIAVAKGMQ